MSIKIAYISHGLTVPSSGMSVVSRTNFELVGSIPDVQVYPVLITKNHDCIPGFSVRGTSSTLQTAIANLTGYSGSLHKRAASKIFQYLCSLKPEIIFVDSSLFGCLIKKIKECQLLDGCRIVAFFHNVEYDFTWHLIRSRGWHYLPALWSNRHNELLSVRHADFVLSITEADRLRLKELYGRFKGQTLPVAMVDSFSDQCERYSCKGPYILFVGSRFFPNVEAVRFLIEKVMPSIHAHLVVVGSEMDLEFPEYVDGIGRVTVFGRVDDLGPFYAGASCVVAPIFSGAGMKVKIAEAMMWGKPLVATRLAMQGYYTDGLPDLYLAESAEDFVNMLQVALGLADFSLSMRDNFLSNYSTEAVRVRLHRIFERYL